MARTLKYAILGLLNQQELTGYDLMKTFESALNEFWSAKHSQIYPELKKLDQEGCIAYKVEIAGSVLEKKLYHITEKGREEFLNWMRSEAEPEATPKEVYRLKIFFSGCLDTEEQKSYLAEQIEIHRLRLEHLKNNQKKFDSVPADPSTSEFGDYLVLMGAVMREETTIEWLERCLEMVAMRE